MSTYGGSIAPPIIFVVIFVVTVTIICCRRRALLRRGLLPGMWGFAQPRHTVVMVAQPGQYPNVPAGAMVVQYSTAVNLDAPQQPGMMYPANQMPPQGYSGSGHPPTMYPQGNVQYPPRQYPNVSILQPFPAPVAKQPEQPTINTPDPVTLWFQQLQAFAVATNHAQIAGCLSSLIAIATQLTANGANPAGIPEGSKKIIIDTGFRIQAEQPSEWRDDVPRLFGQLLRHIGHV